MARNLLQGVKDLCSRCNLERHPYSRGDLSCSLLPYRGAQQAFGLLTVYGVRWLTHSYVCILTADVNVFQIWLKSNIDQHCGQVSMLLSLRLSYCLLSVSPESTLSWLQPSQWDASVTITAGGYRLSRVSCEKPGWASERSTLSQNDLERLLSEVWYISSVHNSEVLKGA